MLTRPYPLDCYDADRRWIAGWPALNVPLPEALDTIRKGLPAARFYATKTGDLRPIPEPKVKP